MRKQVFITSIALVLSIFATSAFGAPPVLEVSPLELNFTADEGGSNPTSEVLLIWRGGGNGPLNWAVTEECDWLVVEPNSGTSMGEVDDVNVIVDISGLTGGTYICQITVAAEGADNSPQIVDVNLVVFGPELQVSPPLVEFTVLEGGPNPADKVLHIWNAGSGTLNWEISEECDWLTVEPNTGSLTHLELSEVNLSVDITGLSAGIYNCDLTVSDPNAWNNPQVVNVSLEVIGPIIEVSQSLIEFATKEGGPNPAEQILSISNTGGGVLNWEISEDCNWLTVEPNTGSSTGEVDDVNLSVDVTGLSAGVYNCELTVSDPNAANSPQVVGVTLLLLEAAPMVLDYDAEAYAYSFVFDCGGGGWSDSAQDFSNNIKAEALAIAEGYYMEGGPGLPDMYCGSDSYTDAGIMGTYDSDGARFKSILYGWGEWWVMDELSGNDSGTGGGSGNGYTSLVGTIGIGVPEGYSMGTPGLTLKIDAEIYGDAPSSWNSWDWWLKIWDDDPNNPLAIVDDSNMSANLDILSGQILYFSLYHEAGKGSWPEAGLGSTIEIDLYLLPFADLDKDGDVDFLDFAILGSQWLLEGELSADIAPAGGNGVVDINDFGLLAESWLWGINVLEPVSYWQFDESTGTIAYDSIGGNDGALYGDPNWTVGQIDGALEFDGVDDYVDVGDPADESLDFGRMDSFTIAAWIKCNKNISSAIVEKRRYYSNPREGYLLKVANDKLRFAIEDITYTQVLIDGLTDIADDQWHHVVGVRDVGNDKLYLYVDGTADATPVTDVSMATLLTGASFRIGYQRSSISPNPNMFGGLIDEMLVYDRALSAVEVEQLYLNGLD